jgi:pimeloyl-ACP methyl ester carboxylesterase
MVLMWLAADAAMGQLPRPGRARGPQARQPAAPQPPAAAPQPPAAVPAKPRAQARKDDKIPPPEMLKDMDLVTKDGVQLTATYYPSYQGKSAAAVILLHTLKGSRIDFASLATKLQAQGNAVLVPDLRGHGESTRVITSAGIRQDDSGRMTPAVYKAMVNFDMEVLKRFLLKKHNEEALNIEKLVLVGADLGAAVAVNWARVDWSWPILAGGKKQGQDVKALVMLSPQYSFPGLTMREPLTHLAIRRMPMVIIAGARNSTYIEDARRIHRLLEPFHIKTTDENQRDLFLGEPDTDLQGTKMLEIPGVGEKLEEFIVHFIKVHVGDRSYPWQRRQ